MRNIVWSFSVCSWCLLLFVVAVFGRPNPVPNDDLTDKDLERYERLHDEPHSASRVKRHRRVRGPEDPDDMDVLDELKGLKGFKGVSRRNRDVYSTRPNIFQKFIDRYVSEDEESKD